MNVNDCGLIMAFYGSEQSRIDAMRTVLDKIFQIQIFIPNIYIVYLMLDNEDLLGDFYPGVTMFKIQGNDKNKALFQKEALYNIGIEKTTEKYLAFLDADLYSEDPLWLMKVFELVERYEIQKTNAVVQMLRKFTDEKGDKYPFSYAYMRRHETEAVGTPGSGWALSRRVLEEGNNFNPWCIPGSGDCCFIMEYIGERKYCHYHFNFKWFHKVFRFDMEINAFPDYADCDLVHIYHGEYKDRAYRTSRSIIDHFGGTNPVKEFVEMDENGLLSWKDPDCGLRHMLENKSQISDTDSAFGKAFDFVETNYLPEIEERTYLDDTALIMCYFGNDEKLLRACKKSLSQILRINPMPHIVFVELIENGSESAFPELSDYDFASHITIETEKQHKNLFQKEACFNIGANSIDLEKYKYLIFHDLDSFPTTSNWAEIIKLKLKTWVETNGNHNCFLQNFNSYFDSVEQTIYESYASNKTKYMAECKDDIVTGLSWSMTSEFFKKTHGWYTKAFNGQNDYIALKRWDSDFICKNVYENSSWSKTICGKFENEEKAIIDYVPANLVHVYHGLKSSRSHMEKLGAMCWFSNDVDDLVYEDEKGLLSWKNDNGMLMTILDETNNFSQGISADLSAQILQKKAENIVYLHSFLHNYMDTPKMQGHVYSFIQPRNIQGIISTLNVNPSLFFQQYETQRYPTCPDIIVVKDKNYPIEIIAPDEKAIKAKIEQINKIPTLKERLKGKTDTFFLVDITAKKEIEIQNLKEKLEEISPNSYLFMIEYKENSKPEPSFFLTQYERTMKIEMKKCNRNSTENKTQSKMLADWLTKKKD